MIRARSEKIWRANVTRYSVPAGQSCFGSKIRLEPLAQCHAPGSAGDSVTPCSDGLPIWASAATERSNEMESSCGSN